jgi:hypothetical protein
MPPDDLPKAVTAEPVAEAVMAGAPPPGVAAGPQGVVPEASTAPAPRRSSGRAGWLVLGAAVIGVALVVVFARNAVVQTWPPAKKLYQALGLPVEGLGAGLKIVVISHSRDRERDKTVLIIKGEVANTSDKVRDVPKLKAALRSADARELKAWTFVTAQSRLLPGEKAPFATRIENPPGTASALNIDFVTSKR